MLRLTIEGRELFDESTNEFISIKPVELQLEHSLVSLSKWESKWKKPFLSKEKKTIAETLDYVRCMTITQRVDPSAYYGLTDEHIQMVNEYIEDPMTATVIRQSKEVRSQETITAEIVYHWMVAYNIPFECQKWHFNRLLTLVNVCSIKSQNQKKRSPKEQLAYNHAMNQARRQKFNSKG